MKNELLHHYFTMDPGWNTATAYWKNPEIINPIVNCIYVNKSLDTEGRLADMWYKFEEELDRFSIVKFIVVESTAYWEESLVSKTSHKRGDIHTLSFLIGGYLDIARIRGIPFMLLPSVKWKGNMDDQQVRRRVKYVSGVDYENSHICDAVGIGLSLQNKFNVRKRRIS